MHPRHLAQRMINKKDQILLKKDNEVVQKEEVEEIEDVVNLINMKIEQRKSLINQVKKLQE